MSLRSDHRLMIAQGEESHYAVLRLADKTETADGRLVTGRWKHTSESYNDTEILFTSDSPEYLYYEWKGGPHGGDLSIGSKMARASHKAGEEEYFQVLITLDYVQRLAGGNFKVGSVLKEGSGRLTYNVNPHFEKGAITWTVVRY